MGHLYLAEQEAYMDKVHLPDSYLEENSWEHTLYNPIRNHISKLVNHCEPQSLFYVGCGPDAPLLLKANDSNQCLLGERFGQVCLSDISPKYLDECQLKMAKQFPDKLTVIKAMDITDGLAGFVFNLIANAFADLSDVVELQSRFTYLSYNIAYIMDEMIVSKNQGVEQEKESYQFICSEMVATYTGIPAILFCERKLNDYFDKGLISKNQQSDIFDLATDIWKKYNDKIFTLHINRLGYMLKPGGTMVIITDVEKIYLDKSKPSISGFSDPNIIYAEFNDLTRVELPDSQSSVEWDDSIRNEALEVDANSFEPHVHKVIFLTLKKNNG